MLKLIVSINLVMKTLEEIARGRQTARDSDTKVISSVQNKESRLISVLPQIETSS